jgi:type IV pilus assembly protein PilB
MLNYVLKKKKILTTSVGDGILLVENIPINGKYNFSSKFLTDLIKRNIESISFLEGLTQTDLKTFLMLLSKQPDELSENGGIEKILVKKGVSKIKVNEIKYERISQRSTNIKDIKDIDSYPFNESSPDEADKLVLEESEKPELEVEERHNFELNELEILELNEMDNLIIEKSKEFAPEEPPKITAREVGPEESDSDFSAEYNEEIKGKITEFLSNGKINKVKEIIHRYSRRLDDKSWQIRKSVTEVFYSVLSELDQLDQQKENFCNLSNIFINKIVTNLKQEDNVDTYLTQTKTLHKICNSYNNTDKYLVDETLGHRLYSDEKISKIQLQKVLEIRKTNGKSLQYNLAALHYTSEKDLTHYLSVQFKGISVVNTSEIKNIPNNILESIPEKYAKRYYSLPFRMDEQRLFTALDNPRDIVKISDLEFISGYKIVPFAAAEYYLVKSIEKFYDGDKSSVVTVDQAIQEIKQEDEGLEFIEEKEEETAAIDECESAQGPIVKLVNLILKEAIIKKASDIHIEPYENELRVRLRVDGSLIRLMNPPFKYRNAISSRIKIMSRLNISERRLPQDGRFKIKMEDKCVDFRVSTFPGPFGEKIVMRLLDKSNLQIDIAKLGMKGEDLKALTGAMYKSKGMILVTGPTGSGKSTTLYSILQKLNDGTRNISTAEDPIEYNIPGINQFQMNPKIGLDFARAMRSFLRQDPDIIMVGEMRDLETAEIAVKASLTGHLVLSTLHTNSAIETITRLLEMGIEPFLAASSVDLIIAQRLMRRICPDCIRETNHPDKHLDYLRKMGIEVSGLRFYFGKGCPNCNHTGYKGRFAIYEVLPIWNEIREMILNRESPLLIQEKAEQLGLITLQKNGLASVKKGLTTIDELMRVAI